MLLILDYGIPTNPLLKTLYLLTLALREVVVAVSAAITLAATEVGTAAAVTAGKLTNIRVH